MLINELTVFFGPVLLFLAIAIIWSTVVITPGKRASIVERLGRPLQKAKMAGLTFKLPWPIDKIVARVNLQLQEISADVSVKTSDNAFMLLPVKAQYRARPDAEGAVRAHYELEDPEQQITSYILNNVRQSAAGMTMIALYQNRDAIEAQVQESLQEQFVQYGYSIENVLIDEPQPSVEVRNAFNRVIASEREKEAAQNIADAKRIELVGVAQAEKESKKLQGEGIAAMREAIAVGMEVAMDTLVKSGLSEQEALHLLMDTNRLDTLSHAATHGNMILADMRDGGALVSTVAAVKAAEHKKPRPAASAAEREPVVRRDYPENPFATKAEPVDL